MLHGKGWHHATYHFNEACCYGALGIESFIITYQGFHRPISCMTNCEALILKQSRVFSLQPLYYSNSNHGHCFVLDTGTTTAPLLNSALPSSFSCLKLWGCIIFLTAPICKKKRPGPHWNISWGNFRFLVLWSIWGCLRISVPQHLKFFRTPEKETVARIKPASRDPNADTLITPPPPDLTFARTLKSAFTPLSVRTVYIMLF